MAVAQAQDWETVAPAEADVAPDVAQRLDRAYDRGDLAGLHAVLVARHGKLILERYYEGPDEAWGRPLGTVAFGPDVLHDLRSVSKSIVGLLYGIALGEGQVPETDASLIEQFPDYTDLASDSARRRMTIAHALTMTLGTEWDESLPYTDDRNSEIAMEMAADRYRYVLSRPIVAEPGSRWTYNGGTTALLAHLVARGTERPLLAYAREKLFQPLGISDVEWTPGTNGEPAAASGLRLRPRALAKIGHLVLNQGRWGAQQVVPADWLEASFRHHAVAEDGLGYGYQWWLSGKDWKTQPWVAGFGNGGQRVVILPDLDLVVVIMAGRYNQPDAWTLSVGIMRDILLPAVGDRG